MMTRESFTKEAEKRDLRAIKQSSHLTLSQIVRLDCLAPWRPSMSGLNDFMLYRDCMAVIEENGVPTTLVFAVYGSSAARSVYRTTTAISIPINLVKEYLYKSNSYQRKNGMTNESYSNIYFDNDIPKLKIDPLNQRSRSDEDLEEKYFGDCKSGKVHKRKKISDLRFIYSHDTSGALLHLTPDVKDITMPRFELSCILKNDKGTHFNGTMLMPKSQRRAWYKINYFDDAMYKFITKASTHKMFTGMDANGSPIDAGPGFGGGIKEGVAYNKNVLVGKHYQGGTSDISSLKVILFGSYCECPPYIFKAFRNLYSNYELLMQSTDISRTPIPFLIHVNWEQITTKEKAIRYAQSRIEQEKTQGIPFGLTFEEASAEIETFDYITEADVTEIQKNIDRFNNIMTARFQSGDYDKYYGYSKSKQNRKKVLDKIFKK